MAELNGKDFIARVRLSDGADHTIAGVGQTCERVPAGKHGGSVSDALQKLLRAGAIAPAPVAAKPARVRADTAPVATPAPAAAPGADVPQEGQP